ncbi:MAG: hypothetical protein IIY84_03410 [Eubacterium sp.]|nr:hypothetical protein [Eubacterium sp.]
MRYGVKRLLPLLLALLLTAVPLSSAAVSYGESEPVAGETAVSEEPGGETGEEPVPAAESGTEDPGETGDPEEGGTEDPGSPEDPGVEDPDKEADVEIPPETAEDPQKEEVPAAEENLAATGETGPGEAIEEPAVQEEPEDVQLEEPPEEPAAEQPARAPLLAASVNWSLSTTSITVAANGKATFIVKDSTHAGPKPTVTSAKPAVATAELTSSSDAAGYKFTVYGLQKGSTTLTVNYQGTSAKITVTVEAAGKVTTKTDKSVSYYMSDPGKQAMYDWEFHPFHTADGTVIFCVEPQTPSADSAKQTHNALEYLDQARLTKIALGLDYINKQSIAADAKVAMSQAWVWRIINYSGSKLWDYPAARGKALYVSGGISLSEAKQQTIFDGAATYAGDNAKLYTGYGIFYDGGQYQNQMRFWTVANGKIQVKKSSTDAAFAKVHSLAGAVYTIYTDAAATTKVTTAVATATTMTIGDNNVSGAVTLLPGTYYVKETKAPPLYKIDTKIYKVVVGSGSGATFTVESVDEPDILTLSVKKVWSKDTEAVRPSDITVTVKPGSGSAITIKGDKWTKEGNRWSATVTIPRDSTTCLVWENLPAGYSSSYGGGKVTATESDPVSFTAKNATASVTITNTHGEEPLTIEKVVAGNLGDLTKEFEFTLSLTGLAAKGTYTYAKGPDGGTGTVTASSKGAASLKFKLKGGESISFSGLPEGAFYTVKENASDHRPSVLFRESGETKQAGYGQALETASRKVTADHEVIFTNEKNTVPVTGITDHSNTLRGVAFTMMFMLLLHAMIRLRLRARTAF